VARRSTTLHEARRADRRAAPGHDLQQRAHIAQVAARLIADHGIADWTLAKRKAAREIGLPDRAPLPGDDEVEAALAEHHALFGGEAHAASLRAQREEALVWLRRLEPFTPRLTGGVAAGWATRHSDIRIDLVAPDAKLVELALINGKVTYRAMSTRGPEAPAELHIETPRGGIRLVVRTPEAARQRTQRQEIRLDHAGLAALLAAPGP
jgi:hypothetical protein